MFIDWGGQCSAPILFIEVIFVKFIKKWYDSLDSGIKIFSIIYSLIILIALFVKFEVSEYIALVSTYSVISK